MNDGLIVLVAVNPTGQVVTVKCAPDKVPDYLKAPEFAGCTKHATFPVTDPKGVVSWVRENRVRIAGGSPWSTKWRSSRPQGTNSPPNFSQEGASVVDTNRLSWGAVVTYHNGDQVLLMVESKGDATECVRIWQEAVLQGRRFCEFPLASGFVNAHLTEAIIRVVVVNQDVLDEQAVEGLRRRKRIEAESDYSGG